MSLWSLGPEQSADDPCSAQFGLAWLIPLWVDRDPEVSHTNTLKYASFIFGIHIYILVYSSAKCANLFCKIK